MSEIAHSVSLSSVPSSSLSTTAVSSDRITVRSGRLREKEREGEREREREGGSEREGGREREREGEGKRERDTLGGQQREIESGKTL